MIKALVNGNHEVIIEKGEANPAKSNEKIVLNGSVKTIDVITEGKKKLHVLCENKSYLVNLVSVNFNTKEVVLKINGTNYSVAIKDENDLLLERLGMSKLTKEKIKDLKAPMPGMVLDVLVKEGDSVKEGDPLVILEAMKMENALKASTSLKIKKVSVKKNQTVEKGQVLINFD